MVDLQHGATAETDLPAVAAAAVIGAGPVPLVRTRSPSFADIGRPIDLGAVGVVPNLRDAAHAREVVAATRYAPCSSRVCQTCVETCAPVVSVRPQGGPA